MFDSFEGNLKKT